MSEETEREILTWLGTHQEICITDYCKSHKINPTTLGRVRDDLMRSGLLKLSREPKGKRNPMIHKKFYGLTLLGLTRLVIDLITLPPELDAHHRGQVTCTRDYRIAEVKDYSSDGRIIPECACDIPIERIRENLHKREEAVAIDREKILAVFTTYAHFCPPVFENWVMIEEILGDEIKMGLVSPDELVVISGTTDCYIRLRAAFCALQENLETMIPFYPDNERINPLVLENPVEYANIFLQVFLREFLDFDCAGFVENSLILRKIPALREGIDSYHLTKMDELRWEYSQVGALLENTADIKSI